MAIVFNGLDDHSSKALWEHGVGLSLSVPKENVLYYSIVRELFWGRIGSTRIGPWQAWSGGGQNGTDASGASLANVHPGKRASYASYETISDYNRGGAIPPGYWVIEPEVLSKNTRSTMSVWGGAPTGTSLRLWPKRIEKKYLRVARHSFYIHGTGGKGSDGCILIAPNNRAELARLVTEHGGAILRVYLSGKEVNDAYERSDGFSSVA